MITNLQSLVERLAARFFPELDRVPQVVIGLPDDVDPTLEGCCDGDTLWLAPRTLRFDRIRFCDVLVHELSHAVDPWADHGPQWQALVAEVTPRILRLPDYAAPFRPEDCTPQWPTDLRALFAAEGAT